MARSTVICDASWCPRTRAGGWAVWININYPNGEHRRVKEADLFHKRPKSSTQAELWAALNGIWFAVRNGATDILVQTDCLSVVQFQGPRVAREHFPETKIRWRHVKGHTGGRAPNGGDNRRYYVNEWCDKHARKYMHRQREQQQEHR